VGYPFGLHHNGMHDYILAEAELGPRVAKCQDDEDCGFGALLDLDYLSYVASQEPTFIPPYRIKEF